MKPNIAVPNKTYNHILNLSYLCTIVHSITLYVETGFKNVTFTSFVSKYTFQILRIFYLFEEYPVKYILFRIQDMQYNINWQQDNSYQICIRVNAKCYISSWTRFLPTVSKLK